MEYTKRNWKAEDRTTRSELGYKVESIMISANGRTVAEVGCWRDRENPEADARLIASAPDLYEALKALITAEDEGFECLGYGRSQDARQAIAKPQRSLNNDR